MSIRLILFDLDGVLCDAKLIHFETLNSALAEIGSEYAISWQEHLSTYDGLKTHQKLELLTQNKDLPKSEYQHIWSRKQEKTQEVISQLQPDQRLIDLCKRLVGEGYTLAVCSNSIRRSTLTMLAKIGVIEYMDLVLSNEDVVHSKPHPEMYWKAMILLHRHPDEVLIVEDSPPGLLAANTSGASVLRVANSRDLTYEKLESKLRNVNHTVIPKWQGNKMNIVIPMAGAGSRFEKAGYTFPKPLIDVAGKPMIQRVIENININAHYHFIVRKEHREKYNLDMMFRLFVPIYDVIEVDHLTEGAACTILLAKDRIEGDLPLLTVDSDQILEWNSNDFMYKMQEQKNDGCIVTFESTHPMWSFVKTDEKGFVTETAEKNPISNQAAAGFYYWAHGSDFIKYAEQMIAKNLRVNNEFYVCPVYNQAVQDGKLISTYHINKRWSLGIPEDLNYYLAHHQDENSQ